MKKLILFFALLLSGCSVVSFHKLTSNLKGKVIFNGDPVSEAKIIFKAKSHWCGEWETKEVVTGKDGEFEVPQWKEVRPFVFVHQPVVEQELMIIYQGKEYEGWKYTRMSYSDKYVAPIILFYSVS
ncbi:DUF6795 domain-containing protein [Microbulbifer variabilis]|uniref:DUF6795 domain-containing protein n=1 Tax=Microbulbifer variabilis TaxID=266805 RepID=UPI000365BB72|nr:DUF6795 domain-containing protein [Microbulbifer variabilis]